MEVLCFYGASEYYGFYPSLSIFFYQKTNYLHSLSLNAKTDLFSPHLFWDVDRSKINLDDRLIWFVGRVLEYGSMKDWILLKNELGIQQIAMIAKEISQLDAISLNFIATIANLPLQDFVAYQKLNQSLGNWVL